MLTGEPPFTGSTAQAIVARVVTENPRPMVPQRGTIPLHVEAAVLTSLQKLPADRFKTASEFAEALTDKSYTSATTVLMPAMRGQGRLSRYAAPLAVLATIATIAALWGWFRPEQPRAVARFGLGFPDGQAPTLQMALAPDGERLVYVGPAADGQDQLWVKERSQYTATPLAGTSTAVTPTFSPDGQWIAFDQARAAAEDSRRRRGGHHRGGFDPLSARGLARRPHPGLLTRGLYPRPGLGGGRSNDRRVANAGLPAAVRRAPVFPTALPGARGVLFSLCTANCAQSELWVLDLKSGDAHMLVPNALQGWYLPTGTSHMRAQTGASWPPPSTSSDSSCAALPSRSWTMWPCSSGSFRT